MAFESWRFRSQIDYHVMNGPLAAPDQLRLLMRCGLKMHAPQSTFLLLKEILHCTSSGFQSLILELSLAPGAGKESPIVFLEFRFNDKGALQTSFSENHE